MQATLIDTWAASSAGAFTLSENNIYTVEAFTEFLDGLEANGVVTMTRWYNRAEPREFLRLVALARAALERRGVDADTIPDHFFLATDRHRRGTLVVGRAPLTADDVSRLHARSRAANLRVLYSPDETAGAGATPDERDPVLTAFLRSRDAEAFVAHLSFDASPSTDDRPFFFYTLRASDLLSLFGSLVGTDLHNLGVLMLLFLLCVSTLLTVALVVAPLLLFRKQVLRENRRPKLLTLCFFLSLGLAFILVEIGLMQRFVLFLGHPIYSLAVVLSTLLAASGVGSALSHLGVRRWGARGSIVRAIATLALLLLCYSFLLDSVFRTFLGAHLGVRIAISVFLVFLPGVFMGTLLPCGIRVCHSIGGELVPWAWGLNGATSVVGSILAVFVSMNVGFTGVLMTGTVAYAVGALFVPRRRTSPGR